MPQSPWPALVVASAAMTVDMLGHEPSYYALRVCPAAVSPDWWASAREASAGAPAAIRLVLAGRGRVEVSAREAIDALLWAQGLRGWEQDTLAPIWIYPCPPGED